jgi:hypothetical protein
MLYARRSSNYAMQRSAIDKVPGRGRLAAAPLHSSHAREPMHWRAVADGGR